MGAFVALGVWLAASGLLGFHGAYAAAKGMGLLGLPFPRISGPFLHPNMMGDYLIVSGLLLAASAAWVGAGVATALLIHPLDLHVLGLELTTGAIRPSIGRSSLAPFLSSPLGGVGAAPFLGEAADRLQGGAVGLWDAHDAYRSILSRFGLVGGGVLAVDALLLAGEDLRRVWGLAGVVGVLGGEAS